MKDEDDDDAMMCNERLVVDESEDQLSRDSADPLVKQEQQHHHQHQQQQQQQLELNCNICGKQFDNLHRLQRHLMCHDLNPDLRKFKCQHCNKAFKFKHHLKVY
jgi:hypothetical protein